MTATVPRTRNIWCIRNTYSPSKRDDLRSSTLSPRRTNLATVSTTAMSEKDKQSLEAWHQHQHQHQSQPAKHQKPPLTHFLCFPLVSDASLPLLEKSLAKFKSNIPPIRRTPIDHPRKPRPQLFPDSALRPLGSLHFTLGVMSLQTPERVAEATKLLQSLDLNKIMQEVESELANSKEQMVGQENSTSTTPQTCPDTISISLQSLEPLPRPKAATVLYAKPVDPTSRLHPFAVKIRNEFVDAGFIQEDIIKQRPKTRKARVIEKPSEGNSNVDTNEHEDTKEFENTVAAESEQERLLQNKPKFRPLLLHATIVNTIYSRGGPKLHSRGVRKGRKNHGPLTFDARDIVAKYRDFYTDDTCTQEKQVPIDNIDISSGDYLDDSQDTDISSSLSSEEEAHPSKTVHQLPESPSKQSSFQVQPTPKYPFIWARDVPIERLCICEMGAKKFAEDSGPLAARLGQEYRVVAGKRLLWESFNDRIE